MHPYPRTKLYREFYNFVPEERKWQNSPEYCSLIKPVFPLQGITLKDAELLINDAFVGINGTESRDASYKFKA